jgi:(p)ppGpp synthase/HD superfamily hydrolase
VALNTGERVEIVTTEMPGPQRAWLDMHLGYVKSGRAREKIQDWFRARDEAVNEQEGRARLLSLLRQLGMGEPGAARWQEAARTLEVADAAALCRAVGAGECQTLDALEALHPQSEFELQMELLPGPGIGDPRIYRIAIRAEDRTGLLHDVTELLGTLSISLIGNSGRVDPATQQAHLGLETRIGTLRERAVLIDRLAHLPGVQDVRVDAR